MRTFKIIILVGVFILDFTICFAQSSNEAVYPDTIISKYKVDSSDTRLLTKAWFWKALGLMPKSFTLLECKWLNNKILNFYILLVDDNGDKWVELYSDTSKRSVVVLPSDTPKTMDAEGIKFIRDLLKFFADNREHRVDGTIILGGDSKLYALADELASFATKNTRRFRVSTYDEKGVYIDGQVLIEYQDSAMIYREVEVFVKESGLYLKLLLNNKIKLQSYK